MQLGGTWTTCLVVALAAQPVLAATEPPPSPLQVATIDVASGMRVLLEVDHSEPIIGLVSVVDCGATKDPAGKEGLAHLIEHLTFRAKPGGKRTVSELLEASAAGGWNAYTDHDLTTFVERAPREALPAVLRLEGARLDRPLAYVEQTVFETERAVVRNELLQRDEQGLVTAAEVALRGALYPVGHPYARPVLGSQASLGSLTLADAQTFVQDCYQPRNFTLLISGDFDPTSVVGLLREIWPARLLARPASGPVRPPQRLDPVGLKPPDPVPDSSIRWVKTLSDSPTLYIGWALPTGSSEVDTAESILALSLRTLAMQRHRDKDILSISSRLDRGRVGNTLILTVVLRTGADPSGSAAAVLRPADGDLMELSSRWLDRIRTLAMLDLARSVDRFDARLLEGAQRFHLTGSPLTFKRQAESLADLNRGALRDLAFYWLTPGRARVVFLKPDDWEPPSRRVGSSNSLACSDEQQLDLPPDALKTYVHGPAIHTHSVVLNNGLEVILVQRPGSTCSATVAIRSGSETASPVGAAEIAERFAPGLDDPVSILSGAVNWFQLPDPGASPSDEGIRLGTRTELDATLVQAVGISGTLERVLHFLVRNITRTRVPDPLPHGWAEELRVLKELENRSTARAERALVETTFADSNFRKLAAVGDYEKLSAADVNGWIERAYRPSDAVAVVVSDLPLIKSEELARAAFADWKGTSQSPEPSPAAAKVPTGPLRTFRVDRPGAKQTEVLLGCAAKLEEARDAVAFQLVAERLRNRLQRFARTCAGGAYSVSATTHLGRLQSNISLSLLVDDESLDRVVALALKELEDLSALPLSSAELGALQWHLGIERTVGFGGSEDVGLGLAKLRAAQLPVALMEAFPDFLTATTREDVAHAAASCRATATLGLVGDPPIVEAALRATGAGTATQR